MGWAQGRYYRRSVRCGRRVRTQYVGVGWLGQAAAWLDQAEREHRKQEQAAIRAVLADTPELTAFYDQVRLLLDAALVASGYHRHKRQWRRRRNGGTMEHAITRTTPEVAPLDWPALRSALVAADAKQPPPGALAELRQLLAAHPNAWKAGGQLGRGADRKSVV